MSNILTPDEVGVLALNRKISNGLIIKAWITVAEEKWFSSLFTRTWVDAVYANTDLKYSMFIEEYLKPVIAYGVVADNFNAISLQITDKGIFQTAVDGTIIVSRDNKLDAIAEYQNNLMVLVNRLINYCNYEKINGNPDYLDFETSFSAKQNTFNITTRNQVQSW